MVGILRALFRLQGAQLWWACYLSLLVIAGLLLVFLEAPETQRVALLISSAGAWMGGCLFLPRAWQLQRHAESLQLPGARLRHAQALLAVGSLACIVPAVLLGQLGATSDEVMLGQFLALISALLYLLLTPILGAIWLSGTFLAAHWVGEFLDDATLSDVQWKLLLGTIGFVLLAFCWRRWLRLMGTQSDGWNTPQIVTIAEAVSLVSDVPEHSAASLFGASGGARIAPTLGPATPTWSLAMLACGPLAPLGWRNYFVNSGWKLLAVGFLAAMAFCADPESKGPLLALIALISVWAMAMPLTIITRLRAEWRGDGQSFAEVALLPGLVTRKRSWWPILQAVVLTASYRLALPSLLALGVLWAKQDVIDSGIAGWLLAMWSSLLMASLLPIAHRSGGLSTIELFVMSGVVALAVLAGNWHFIHHRDASALIIILTASVAVPAVSWLAVQSTQHQNPWATS